jgi:hypothetical protein
LLNAPKQRAIAKSQIDERMISISAYRRFVPAIMLYVAKLIKREKKTARKRTRKRKK